MPSLLPRLDLADLEPMANRHTTEQLFPGRRSGHRASPRAQLDKVGHIPAIPAAKAPTSAGEPGVNLRRAARLLQPDPRRQRAAKSPLTVAC